MTKRARHISILIFSLISLTFPFVSNAALLYGGDPFYNDERASIGKQIFIEPHPISGAYTYEYPFTLPPGRNGFKPDLSLVYSSQSNSNISPFGYGWSISIPSIERIPRNGTDNLYNQNEIDNFFYSTLDGEIVASSTTIGTEDFGPLVENGDFRKYEYVNNMWWKVTDKNGTAYAFGVNATGRQNDPNIATSTFKWMLEEVRDRNGNYISYTYYKNNGQIYPSTITYTGNGSTDGIYEISFSRESKNDIATSTLPGFAVVSDERIDEILVKVDGTWVRKYELTYTTQPEITMFAQC